MAVPIYFLCMFTSALCAFLLLKAYRQNRLRVLFWSGWCFVGLTLTNLVMILDRLVFPEVDLFIWRLIIQLIALMLLVIGLIWRED